MRTISRKVNTIAKVFALASGTLLSGSLLAAEPPAKDLFAGDVWHAMSPAWPGTLTFDGKAKKVTLAPMGAPTIVATYTYTLEQKTASEKSGNEVRGTLTMTSSKGEVSQSRFSMRDRRNLSLEFKEGQRSEQYVRMSPAEEEAERVRIQKLFNDGKLRLP